MAKRAQQKRSKHDRYVDDMTQNVIPFERSSTNVKKHGDIGHMPSADRTRVEFLKPIQSEYYTAIQTHTVTFGLGPAGTGKTHVAVGRACEALMDREIDQIVITRPMVGVSRTIGFLPGTAEEKFGPFFRPVKAIMEKFLGRTHLEYLVKNEKVVVLPLEFIRGTTFDRAYMIMDEAQNSTKEEMCAFLTRIGHYTTVVINGDIEQVDLKEKSGLVDALERFGGNPKFGSTRFEISDIVRDDIVKDVIVGYRSK